MDLLGFGHADLLVVLQRHCSCWAEPTSQRLNTATASKRSGRLQWKDSYKALGTTAL